MVPEVGEVTGATMIRSGVAVTQALVGVRVKVGVRVMVDVGVQVRA